MLINDARQKFAGIIDSEELRQQQWVHSHHSRCFDCRIVTFSNFNGGGAFLAADIIDFTHTAAGFKQFVPDDGDMDACNASIRRFPKLLNRR